jgi:hypothetical protein
VAKPELRDHRKFLKLKRLLGEPTPHLIGYLECLWLRGYQTGDSHIGDSLDVEAAAEYPGEAGRFTTAAHQAGFIDQDEAGSFSIHDLFDHAPAYAKKRMGRRGNAPPGTNYPGDRPADVPEPSRAGGGTLNSVPRGTQSLEPRTENLEPRTESLNSPGRPAVSAPEFQAAWNASAAANGWATCTRMSQKRVAKLKQRVADPEWVRLWRDALIRAGPSLFLRGTGDRGWVADVDWFLAPDSVTKILEGKYDNRASPAARRGPEDRDASLIRQAQEAMNGGAK